MDPPLPELASNVQHAWIILMYGQYKEALLSLGPGLFECAYIRYALDKFSQECRKRAQRKA